MKTFYLFRICVFFVAIPVAKDDEAINGQQLLSNNLKGAKNETMQRGMLVVYRSREFTNVSPKCPTQSS